MIEGQVDFLFLFFVKMEMPALSHNENIVTLSYGFVSAQTVVQISQDPVWEVGFLHLSE